MPKLIRTKELGEALQALIAKAKTENRNTSFLEMNQMLDDVYGDKPGYGSAVARYFSSCREAVIKLLDSFESQPRVLTTDEHDLLNESIAIFADEDEALLQRLVKVYQANADLSKS